MVEIKVEWCVCRGVQVGGAAVVRAHRIETTGLATDGAWASGIGLGIGWGMGTVDELPAPGCDSCFITHQIYKLTR